MNLDPLQQVLLQLGAIGAMLFVIWKLGEKWLDRQAHAEKERTSAIAEGFKQITTSLSSHTTVDLAAHDRMAESHGELRDAVVRLEGKVDAALDWQERTPVDGRIPTPPRGYEERRTPQRGYAVSPTQYGPSRPGTKER